MPTTEMEAGDMVTDSCITTDYFKVPVSAMVTPSPWPVAENMGDRLGRPSRHPYRYVRRVP